MKIELSIAASLGPLDATNIFDIIYWCSDYERRNKYPATILNRFAIGFYQIHQGMEWKDSGINKYESFAAAILHFTMVATRLNLPIEQFLELDLDTPYKLQINWTEVLLKNLSGAQQQLFYASKANKTSRASRYSGDKLCKRLGISIRTLMSIIPIHLRKECFYCASRIMTREL